MNKRGGEGGESKGAVIEISEKPPISNPYKITLSKRLSPICIIRRFHYKFLDLWRRGQPLYSRQNDLNSLYSEVPIHCSL